MKGVPMFKNLGLQNLGVEYLLFQAGDLATPYVAGSGLC